MKIQRSKHVESDLEAIADRIARDNPGRAFSYVREIRDLFQLIRKNPRLYRLRPELGPDIRLAVHRRHVIIYRIISGKVRIERISDGARDLAALMAGDEES